MRRYVGILCISIFFLFVGAIGGIAFVERMKTAAPPSVSSISISGADSNYAVGDIISLSITNGLNTVTTPNLLGVKYDWYVVDPNQPNKNFVKSRDGTTVNFGTGSKPTQIKVLVNSSYVTGTKDVNGNFKDISLQTSGISSVSVNVVDKVPVSANEKKRVADELRGRATRIEKENLNVTEAHRLLVTTPTPQTPYWNSWEKENYRVAAKTNLEYAKLCGSMADQLEGK